LGNFFSFSFFSIFQVFQVHDDGADGTHRFAMVHSVIAVNEDPSDLSWFSLGLRLLWFEFYMALLRCHQFHHFFIHLFSFKMMGTKIPLDSSRLSLWLHVLQMRLDMALTRCHQFGIAKHSALIMVFCTLNSSRLSLWLHVLQMRLDMALTRCHQFGIAKHSALIMVFCTLKSSRLSLWSPVLQMRLDMALARCHQFITGHLHVTILHSSTTLPPIHSFIPSLHSFFSIFQVPNDGGRWYPWNHHGFLYDCGCSNGP
jgi:hypothetical protein